MADRSAVGFLLATALLGFLQTASSFEVKGPDGKICLSANFSMQFTVDFTKSKKQVKLLKFKEMLRENAAQCC